MNNEWHCLCIIFNSKAQITKIKSMTKSLHWVDCPQAQGIILPRIFIINARNHLAISARVLSGLIVSGSGRMEIVVALGV